MRPVACALLLLGCEAAPTSAVDWPGPAPAPAATPTMPTDWCAPQACVDCKWRDMLGYKTLCPEMVAWCDPPMPSDLCPGLPGELVPIFCTDPSELECIHIDATACDGASGISCCWAARLPLPPQWYCQEPADCPNAPACLLPQCLATSGANDPYGFGGKCAYAPAPDNTPCAYAGGNHCVAGVCVL